MGQHLSYLYQSQWVTEGSQWRPSIRPPTPDIITLRDEIANVISSSSMTTMVMTLYDRAGGENAIINGVDHVDVKNTRSCTISSVGVFTLTLLPGDTLIIESAHAHELRTALIEYTWASGTKADALEVDFVIKNIHRRGEAMVSAMRVMDAAQVTLI